MANKVKFSIAFDPELAIRVDTQCQKERKTRTNWVSEAVKHYIKYQKNNLISVEDLSRRVKKIEEELIKIK